MIEHLVWLSAPQHSFTAKGNHFSFLVHNSRSLRRVLWQLVQKLTATSLAAHFSSLCCFTRAGLSEFKESEDKFGVVVYIAMWYIFNIGESPQSSLMEAQSPQQMPLRNFPSPRIQHLQQEGFVDWLQPNIFHQQF